MGVKQRRAARSTARAGVPLIDLTTVGSSDDGADLEVGPFSASLVSSADLLRRPARRPKRAAESEAEGKQLLLSPLAAPAIFLLQ